MEDNTVFDSVFKTMVHKAPQLMIPLINEVFGRGYPRDAPMVQFSNEFETKRGKRIVDSVFRVEGKIYHVECQSKPDSDMVVRMIEYDFNIAFDEMLANGAPYRMEFPASCVLFLRHSANTPDHLQIEVRVPDGGSFEYRTKVVKAQSFSSDDIFGKGLLVLLPYYLLRYEKALEAIASDGERTMRLIAECTDLRVKLAENTLREGETILYEQMTELIIEVADHLTAKHEALRKKVRAAMGGEVLELWRERAERMEREARERGIEQGIERGIEQAVVAMTEKLSSLGVDKATIEQAVATLRSNRETHAKE